MNLGSNNKEPSENSSVNAAQRRDSIITVVHQQGSVSVLDLSKMFSVSAATIRSDLALLQHQGLLEKVHGGAMVPLGRLKGEVAYQARSGMHQHEKNRIGQAAAELVEDGDTILIDSSTTGYYVARNLKYRRDLKVVTNGINTALELMKYSHYVIMVGGILNERTVGTVGRLGRNTLAEIRVQKAFLGARGVTIRDGLTDANLYEVELKQAMVEIASELIAIVDSAKFNVVGFASFAPIGRVSTIITDNGIDPNLKKGFEKQGIRMIIV